jgi:hypothetical protein
MPGQFAGWWFYGNQTFLDEKLNGGIGDLAASSFDQFGVLDLGRDVFCSDQLLHGNLYTGVMKVCSLNERSVITHTTLLFFLSIFLTNVKISYSFFAPLCLRASVAKRLCRFLTRIGIDIGY